MSWADGRPPVVGQPLFAEPMPHSLNGDDIVIAPVQRLPHNRPEKATLSLCDLCVIATQRLLELGHSCCVYMRQISEREAAGWGGTCEDLGDECGIGGVRGSVRVDQGTGVCYLERTMLGEAGKVECPGNGDGR